MQAADALSRDPSACGGRRIFFEPGRAGELLAVDRRDPGAGGPATRPESMSLAKAWRVGLACEALWTVARLRGEPPMTRFLASQLATSHWFDIIACQTRFWLPAARVDGGGHAAAGRLAAEAELGRERGSDVQRRVSRPSRWLARPITIAGLPIHRAINRLRGPSCCELIPAANLRVEHVGKTVTLCGWVDSYRDHGGGLFVDLRDRYGITQVVFNPPDTPAAIIEQSKTLRAEYVIKVTGVVAQRPDGMANPKLRHRRDRAPRHATSSCSTRASTPPVSPNAYGQDLPNEDLRLEVSLSRPAAARDAADAAAARPHDQQHARLFRRR